MEPAQDKKQEEETFDLGNFSDFDENGDGETCGGDNKHKSDKDPSKEKTCKNDENKTCGADCQKKAEEIPADKICKKCKEQRGTLKYRSEPACKECYLGGMEHRFRSSLRTQVKLSKKDDVVLCCLSGGQSSLAMCRMISQSLFNPGPRRMFFKAKIIHINEAALKGVSEEEEQQNIAKIKKFAEQYQLEVAIRNIEDIYDIQNPYLKDLLFKSYGVHLAQEEHKEAEFEVLEKGAKRQKIKALIDSLSDTGSSKEDLFFVFKKILIVDYALNNKLTKVFFADTAQKVAINSLTLLCKGRGADLFEQTAAEEKVFGDVIIYRPMNDFLTKEILVYDYFNKLDEFYIIYPKFEDFVPNSKKYPGNGSINTLLENFVNKLQAGFPSTVHTVLNTLPKVKPKFDERKICPICWGNKDRLGNILEKGSIIEYLQPQGQQEQIKEKPNDKIIDMEFESKKIKEDYLKSDYFNAKSPLEKAACFSCGRIFENAKDVSKLSENLPSFMQSNVQGLYEKVIPKSINQQAFDYYFYDYDGDL